MKPYKRMALISAITLVCSGCLSTGALLVFERAVTHQPLPTTLHSALGSAGPRITAPAPLGHDSRPSAGNRLRVIESYGRMPLSFEANAGQTDSRVKFLSRGRGYTLFLTGNEAVLTLRSPSSAARNPLSSRGGIHDVLQQTAGSEPPTPDTVLRMGLVGATANVAVVGGDELPGKANYFIGNDPKKWRTNVPTYSQVAYRNVYPGIDLVYYGNQGGQLQYDFVVAPGADPQAIALDVGAGLVPFQGRPQGSPLQIAADGDLVIPSKGGELRFRKPVVYQEQPTVDSRQLTAQDETRKTKNENRHLVEGHFLLDAQNRVHFALGPYDHTQPLVIDPTLVYSTYLGGSALDSGYGIAVDSSGNAYVTGYTSSANFPTTANPLQASLGGTGATNAFVAELHWATSTSTLSLVYSTYLGGTGTDYGYGIAVDSSGNAYVTGVTSSGDFPIANPLQDFLAGTHNAFVTELDSTGANLVYSTYLGGSSDDYGYGIAVDSSGNAYLTGLATSYDFPTLNPVQASLLGGRDAFVAKLNWDDSSATLSLVYSTYLGGYTWDAGYGIAVDSSGNAYVTGLTMSVDFPTAHPIQASLYGSENAFVAELNWAPLTSKLSLVYSTYLGGGGSDFGRGIAVDSSGNAYVTGYASSPNFPTVHPLQASLGATGATNAFVAKLNWVASGPTLSLVYSTYLGGSGSDIGYGIAVDSSGGAYVTGYASSPNFPTVQPLQASLSGRSNAFVAKLNWAASSSTLSLIYSTYLGGGGEYGYGIAVDSSGSAYVTGVTSSSKFPTAHPLQASLGGASDAFVAKISAAAAAAVTLSTNQLPFGSELIGTKSSPQSVTLTSSGTGVLTIASIGISGDFALAKTATSCPYSGGKVASKATCTIDVTFTPTATGTRKGSVTISDNAADSPQSIGLSGTGLAGTNSTTVITSHTPNPSAVGQAVTVAFKVSPKAPATGTPTGNVTVSDGTGDTCTASVATGRCALTIKTAGTKTLTASYAGDTKFSPSTSPGVLQSVGGSSTKTTITSSTPNPSVAGQSITVSFTVTAPGGGTPTGNVVVSDGAGDACQGTVAGGMCFMLIHAAGKKTLTASYAGGGSFSPSTSAGVTQNVIDFSISARPTPQAVNAGQKATYTITLTPLGGFTGAVALSCGGVPPSSTCTFSPNSLSLTGTASASSTATIQTSGTTTKAVYTLTFTGTFGSGRPATNGLTHSTTAGLSVN